MSMYGVPTAQCEPIRSRNLSPLPRNRFLDPESVIAEGIKGGGKTLPANIFSVPARTIGGRIRKVSQYSVRSDDDEVDDDGISYLSAAEEELESSSDTEDAELRSIERSVEVRRRRASNISRTRSENDVRIARDDIAGSRQFVPSPFLTVPEHGEVPVIRRRAGSVRSFAKGVRGKQEAKTGRKRRSPKSRRKSLPVANLQRSTLVHRTTSPPTFPAFPTPDQTSAGRGQGGLIGMAGTALAGAGMMAMGVGGGQGLKGVVVENDLDDAQEVLSQSPSPPTIEINLQEEDGSTRRISSVAGQFDELEKSVSPSPPPPPPPLPLFSLQEVEEMRRVLKFFFMDPIQKWKAKRRFPWKLCLQLLKIVFITVQLCLFASQRSAFITFTESNKVAFEHLFLQDWDPTLEGMPYPPPRGPYAVYEKKTFFDIIDYAITNYFNMSDLAVGTYAIRPPDDKSSYGLHSTDDDSLILPPKFCQSFFPNASIQPENNNYSFPSRSREECIVLGSFGDGFSIREELFLSNMTIDFETLINATLKFKVKTIHFRSLVSLDFVTCYVFDVNILMDNHAHNGQIPVTLKIKDHWQGNCSGVTAKSYHEDEIIKGLLIFFDATCIWVSVLSMVLCLRSMKRAYRLCKKTEGFLMAYKGNLLSPSERWEFVNFWYLTIILNDILAIIGSFSKILMETNIVIDWNLTGLALGTSNLLVWVGVLRYLSFFSRYNILIVTLKHAMPDLIRFLVCTLVLFFGFVFCGWAVLGPYNLKFRTIWSTMWCLFSLVNGDDMFVTFTASSPESPLVWYYSQCYLYAFICLFIYVNISLFTAVILDSYSLIKYYYQHGFPKSDLFEFIDECSDPPEGESYRQRSLSTLPTDRRPKSRVSQHSVSRTGDDSIVGVAATSAPALLAAPLSPKAYSWKSLRTAVAKSTVNCFRCCNGGRRRKHASNVSGYANHSRINRTDSHRQQLVYSSESDDDTAFPGATVHM